MNDSIQLDLSASGDHLYLFFSGGRAGRAAPKFEFRNASNELDHKKVFIRDLKKRWYQDGLPGLGDDIYSTARGIEGLIREIGPSRTFFVGNSMGGFAAILFHALIGEGEAIAFAPQTFISPLLRLRHRDKRWQWQVLTTYRTTLRKQRILNLRPLLLDPGRSLDVTVFVSKGHRIDQAHVANIVDIPGIRVHQQDGGGHWVVKVLRDEGRLPAILSGSFALPERATA